MDNLSLKRKKRTGFTLVELLVVIAILAVLASVSVIGYLSFVKKARVSNDVSLTTQMNTVLASNEVVDGKNATPYDAISELDEDGGFDVNKISPTANGYFFGFDTTDNRMVLFDEGMNVVAPEGKSVSDHERDVFLLVGSESELKSNSDYSYYLKDNFVDKEGDNAITVSTGVDTGTNEIGTVNYTNTDATAGQEVLIRTGSFNTTLNIYAPSDTVKHYDVAGMVNVRGIATSSYHEHGNVAAMEINGGHVVVEEKGVVDLMYMNPKAYTVDTSSGEIKVDNIGVAIATSVTNNGDIDHAHASSKDEADNQNGTEGTAGKSTGVIFDYNNNTEQNAVDDVWHHVGDKNAVTGSGEVTNTEEWASDEKVQSQKTDTAKEFQFNLPETLTIGDGETEHFKNGEKYTFESSDESVAYVANGILTANDIGTTTITANGKSCVVTVTPFHDGTGVETDPYIIINEKQLYRMSSLTIAYNSNYSCWDVQPEKGDYSYYKVGDGIKTLDMSSVDCWPYLNVWGSFDGNGVTFINANSYMLFWHISGYDYANKDTQKYKPVVLKNFNVKDCNLKTTWGGLVYEVKECLNVTLENVNIIGGTITGTTCVGSFLTWGSAWLGAVGLGDVYVTFKNCNSSATLIGGSVGGFIAHPYTTYSANNTQYPLHVTIDNSYFTGIMNPSGNSDARLINGNTDKCYVTFKNMDSSKINYLLPNAESDGTYNANSISYNKSMIIRTKVIVGELPNKGETFTVNKDENAASADVKLFISPNSKEFETGCYTGCYLEEHIEWSNGVTSYTTTTIKYYDIAINPEGVTAEEGKLYNITGNTFSVIEDKYGNTYANAYVLVIQYLNDGTVSSIIQYSFPM